MRLQNQFRSLDEDEVEFLDSVLESTRTKDAEVRKQTREQLEAFRAQQEEAEKVARQEEEEGVSMLTPSPPTTRRDVAKIRCHGRLQ